MEIIIHIDAKKADPLYKPAMEEYIKRTSPFCKIALKYYKSFSQAKGKSGSSCIRLVPGTSTLSSPDFSGYINNITLSGFSCIEFFISENSFSPEMDELCLTSFSIPAGITAVALCEQIYRAFTIANNITYHK